jgi:hypothetical protein
MTLPVFYFQRFEECPFELTYKISYANPRVSTTEADPAQKKATRWWIRPSEFEPGIFLDPGLGAAAFFTHGRCTINNERADVSDLGEFQCLFQSLNRRYTTDDFYRAKYGCRMPRINNTTDFHSATKDAMPAALKEAVAALDSDDWDNTQPLVSRFTLDCLFPISSQSNILAALMKQNQVNGYIRPSSEIVITLFKRSPVDALIESFRIPDNAAYGDVDVTAAHAKPELKVEFEGLKLFYESFTPDARSLHGFLRATPKYYVDKPYFYYASVAPGVMLTRHDIPVQPGTKAMIYGFIHGHQMFRDPNSNRSQNARIRFIPNAKEFKLKMDHKDNFYFAEGVKDPGIAGASLSSGLRGYHASLVRKGLTDQPFESVWPRKFATVKGYQQPILLDLSDLKIEKQCTLTPTVSYNSDLSPRNWFIFAIGLQQYQLTHLTNNKWLQELRK